MDFDNDSPWTENDLDRIMVKEDYTNAVWNYILHQAFPAPDYAVVPELRFKDKDNDDKCRADLGVMKLGKPNRLIVVYEGKKSGGQFFTINDALNQAKACADTYTKHTPVLIARSQNCIHNS